LSKIKAEESEDKEEMTLQEEEEVEEDKEKDKHQNNKPQLNKLLNNNKLEDVICELLFNFINFLFFLKNDKKLVFAIFNKKCTN
jgi:hypothetical protein